MLILFYDFAHMFKVSMQCFSIFGTIRSSPLKAAFLAYCGVFKSNIEKQVQYGPQWSISPLCSQN